MKYSKDFNFFIEHQVFIVFANNKKHISFNSRLEAKNFLTIDGSKELTDEQINEHLVSIHNKLKQ